MRTASARGARVARWGSIVTGGLIAGAALAADALAGADPGVGAAQAAWIAVGAGVCCFFLLPVRWNQRALLVVVAAGAAGVLAEGALRLFTPWAAVTIFEMHPRYLHRYVAGSSKMFRRLRINGGQSNPVSINAQGFRGGPLARPTDGLRVVVYGDSCIAAEYSPLHETFVARLGDHLAAATGRTVEAVNAGVVGYGPDQSLLRMTDELPWLEADLVVMGLFAENDLGDLLRNKFFRLGPRGELEDNPHSISADLEAWFREARLASALGRLVAGEATFEFDLPAAGSTEAVALEEARMLGWIDQCHAQYAETVIGADPFVMNPLADHYDADVSLDPGSESAAYKVHLMDRVVAAMADVAERADVPLVVLVIPSPVDVCDGLHVGRVDRTRFPGYDPARLSGTLSAIVRRNGVPLVDLYGPFAERDADTLHFKYGNGHWNAAGQDLAATLLADYIVAENLLR